MNTEKAIEFLELHRWKNPRNILALKGFKDVEFLLQQGEKYRQMWGEFYKKYGLRFFKEHFYEDFSQDKFYGTNTPIKDLMKNLEQKYFPKEASQDYKEGEE